MCEESFRANQALCIQVHDVVLAIAEVRKQRSRYQMLSMVEALEQQLLDLEEMLRLR